MDQQAQIQIQYVNQRNGKKPPTVRDANGNYFTITDGSLGMFTPGQVGDAVFYINNSGYTVMKSWNGQPLPKGQAQQAQQPMYTAPVQTTVAPISQINQQTPSGHIVDEDEKQEAIFVTGVVGRSMQSGKYDISDIDRITKEAVRSWRNRNMAEPIPTQRFENGMPDDVPPANGPEDYGQSAAAG